MKILIIPLAAVLVSCVPTTKYTSLIESNGKSNRVEVNNEYVGQTPLVYSFRGYRGRFIENTIIRCYPNINGRFVQQKSFSSYGHTIPNSNLHYGEKIPQRMFFDMRLVPPQTRGVNIHVY